MIEKILITSFIVFAIYTAMQEDHVFEKLGKFLQKSIQSDYWQKPVFSCVVCMGGIYGALIYWIIWGNHWTEWLIVNISTIGLNSILTKLFPKDACEVLKK